MAFKMVSLAYPSLVRHITSYRHISYDESLVSPENIAICTGCLYADVDSAVFFWKMKYCFDWRLKDGSCLLAKVNKVRHPTKKIFRGIFFRFDFHCRQSFDLLIYLFFDIKSPTVAPSSDWFCPVAMTDSE